MFLDSDRQRKVVRITVWVAVLGLLLGVLSSILTAVAADAHASLTSITPADKATVKQPLNRVTLVFNEPVSASFATVTVTGPGGSATSGKAKVDGGTVTQDLEPTLPNGVYTLKFRVVSDDGHPISDSSTFTLAVAPSSLPSSSGTVAPSPTSSPTASAGAIGATTQTPTAAAPSGSDSDRALRIGLAVGVGALAVAGGVAFVAVSRRRQRS